VGRDRSATDDAGELLRDRREATQHAREIARELIQSQMDSGEPPSGWIEVEDEEHRPIFMLPLRAMSH
jgi:hypothetical protein